MSYALGYFREITCSASTSIAAHLERCAPSKIFEQYILLGEDKLRANVGINLVRQGVECYHALMDAGVNWYEASAQVEFILESGNEIGTRRCISWRRTA